MGLGLGVRVRARVRVKGAYRSGRELEQLERGLRLCGGTLEQLGEIVC